MIHPPMLYSGYTLCAVPLAFAVGALVTRRLGAEWIRTVRPFALAAWLCLGIGVVLGARWSYAELGWGGYWAWDGVENAALMPWLTGTAFLHSVMIQERRGMLKVWNVSLVLATGILALLGTFIVRSGILDSIHAFGASTLGIPFLVLLTLMIGGSIALVTSRLPMLRSEHRLDSLVCRESVFLLNNLVLVGLCFVVFWGTFFPLISEAITGHAASVGPPWFGRFVVPLALVLTLLAGLGPGARLAAGDPGRAAARAAVPGGGGRRGPGRARRGRRDRERSRRRWRCSASPPSCWRWWRRSSGAACARAGRCPTTRFRPRSWRSCAATAGATGATWSTRASRCCSSALPRRRRSRRPATCACRPASAPGSTATS